MTNIERLADVRFREYQARMDREREQKEAAEAAKIQQPTQVGNGKAVS